MRLKSLFFIATIVFFATSCEYKMIEEIKPDIPDGEDVSFSEKIEPLFGDCAGCHSGGISLDLSTNIYTNLTAGSNENGAYINTDEPEQSELVVKLSEDGHSSYLTATEKALIELWIEQGAQNN